VLVAAGEVVRAVARLGDRASPGSAVMSSKIRQNAALTSGWACFGDLGEQVAGPMDQAALPQ
jgi:hypothetical protein